MAYLKCVYAAALAGLGAASASLAQGSGHIGYQAIVVIATATITAAGVVWGVPNAPKAPPAA